MRHIEFGFILPADNLAKNGRDAYVANVDRALDLVAGRFTSAWLIDHLQFGDADVLEGFTTLTYFAARHPQMMFGHTVLCQSFRNPALVAKMGATLQYLTGGRFVLGIGAGWHEEEYAAYGYDFPRAGVRVEQLEEALQIIRALWREPSVTFAGDHYRVQDARCEPKPIPVPPVMLGAFKPRMLGLTAKYADWWNVSSTGVADYAAKTEELERACDAVGRDPHTIRRTWAGGCVCRATQTEARKVAAERYGTDDDDEDDGFDFVGTPEMLVEQMHGFIALGVDCFMLDCGGFPDLTTLALLADEVLPQLT